MRILYEGAIYQILRFGGVARCFTDTIRHLPRDCEPIFVGPSEDPPSFGYRAPDYVGVRTQPPVSWMRKMMRERMQRQITATFDATPADLEHWTYYSGLCRRPIRKGKRPTVVTIFDFVHESFPSLNPNGNHIAQKQRAIEVADHLICISQSTHDELCERFPAAREKSTAIPLRTSLADVVAGDLPGELVGNPYILFVGRRNSYKNFSVLWKAWQRLKGKLSPDAKLVLAGPPMKRREAAELGWEDDPSTVLIHHPCDRTLKALYENAQAFVFPSKAEGFGLPSLEAMHAGAPVIVSDIPIMREVVGECGYFFDPEDASTLSEIIESSLADHLPDRGYLIQAARERAAKFTWTETAEKTAEVYHQLVGNEVQTASMMHCVA